VCAAVLAGRNPLNVIDPNLTWALIKVLSTADFGSGTAGWYCGVSLDATSPPVTDRPWPPRPKEVGARMRRYELMVLLDPDVEEKTVAPSLDQFLGVVRQDGGTVEKVDVWGRRRLAFEILKKSEAIYAVIDLVAEPASVRELDRQLNLNETVLRTKLMRPEKH
jgi:small subunit ribosomal protein S6